MCQLWSLHTLREMHICTFQVSDDHMNPGSTLNPHFFDHLLTGWKCIQCAGFQVIESHNTQPYTENVFGFSSSSYIWKRSEIQVTKFRANERCCDHSQLYAERVRHRTNLLNTAGYSRSDRNNSDKIIKFISLYLSYPAATAILPL